MKNLYLKNVAIAFAGVLVGLGWTVANAQSAPRPLMDVPNAPRLVQQVQVTDPRVPQLEEQVRQLRGRVEELNFIMLELQEQLRRTQEDNEFRFQQLEEQDQSNAAPAIKPLTGETETAAIENETPLEDPQGTQSLGSIQFDADGNAINASINTAPEQNATGAADYDGAYSAFISGDFIAAEKGFQGFIDQEPNDPLIANAHYWLGESILAQGRYNDAAEVFLEANRQFPEGAKAPEALIKLGVALTALDKRDIACAVFEQFGARYPDADTNLQNNLDRERQRASCG